MLQPAGVSARPAFIRPVPLNRTFRSPDPRPAPIKPPERCPHCNSPRLIKKGEILEALTLYDRGSTLQETARTISWRHGHPVAASTIC